MFTRLAMAIVLVLVVPTGPSSSAEAQMSEDSIWVGGTTLRVGMPQERAISQLVQYYAVDQEATAPGVWLISEKGHPTHIVGTATFKDGKLKNATKTWGPEDTRQSLDFGDALYGVIASFVHEGRRDCWIAVKQTQEPRFELRWAYLVCGQKDIAISVSRGSPSGATIQEEVGDVLPADVVVEKLEHDLKKNDSRYP